MNTEPHREDSEPSTYVRGYHKLATEDPPTSGNRHTDPQGPYPTTQPYTGAGPYSSSYTPAPHVQSSATAQQSSNVREHNLPVWHFSKKEFILCTDCMISKSVNASDMYNYTG